MRVPPVPLQSCLGCAVRVYVFRVALLLQPAKPGRHLWCVCLGLGFTFTPPIVAGVLGCVCVCVCVRVALLSSPCQSWLGSWAVCVCGGAPPAPFQSWPGCAVRVFGCGFALQHADPGSGSWWVCLCASVAFTPPILARMFGCVCLCACSACIPRFLAEDCGVCLWLRVSLSCRQSWLLCWAVCVSLRAPPVLR